MQIGVDLGTYIDYLERDIFSLSITIQPED